MLSFLIYVEALFLVFAVYYGLTLARSARCPFRTARIWTAVCTAAGFLFGTGIYIAKRLEPKKLLNPLTRLNRQVIAAAWVILLLALLVWLISLLVSKRTRTGRLLELAADMLLSVTAVPLLAHLLPQLYLKTGEFVAFGEDSIGTATLFRAAGYFLGILLIFLLCLSIFHLWKRLEGRSFTIFTLLLYLTLVLDMSLRGISSLARLRLISSKLPLVFDIMIFEDKSLPYTATCYLVAVLLASVYLFATHLRIRGSFDTKAKLRKHRWWLRNCRRWAVSAVVFMVTGFILVTAVNAYINRPVQLAPAEQYLDSGSQIIIPLTQVEDGHLHRFSYVYEGHNIRFIVVRKPNSNAYGVGLDACDICGIAGYFERNDTVVCKRCDVVMNKATIGFKGGCNPVPFPYVVKDGQIVIDKTALQNEKDRFPVGE